MKKTFLAMLAMTAALSASAVTIELITNGDGTRLDGWTNSGSSDFAMYNDGDDSWFRPLGAGGRLSQTIELADKGITPGEIANGPTVTASVIAQGGLTGSAKVFQLDADGGVLDSHTVFEVNGEVAQTSYPEIDFKLKPGTRTLRYELAVDDMDASYRLKFRDCSLKITQYRITFLSNGATVGTSSLLDPPTAPGNEGYRFLGYFTQTAGGERIIDESYTPVDGFAWTPTDGATLYAHWVIESVNFSFVSDSATVGSAEFQTTNSAPAAPTVSRNGDYQFLGYFTEDGLQVYDEDFHFVQSSLSSLSSNVTLYAHWAVPEGSMAKLVYRGQLNLLTGEPAVHDTTYTKKMHFRVYDGSEATTPLWQTKPEGVDVTVNADGSFVHAFGDEALAALIATGRVSHVGLALGNTASLATELKPRRELRSVAAVNRALTAEGAALDIRVGNLVTENAVVAADATVSHLEVADTVTAPGAGKVSVSPLALGAGERTQLLRGKGVKALSSAKPTVLATSGAVLRGDVLATAPADGIALVSSCATGDRALRCPAVVQYCRKDEKVRAPTSDAGGLKVTFFPFVGNDR